MIGRMITIVALIGALGAMAVGGYIYLAPQQRGRTVEGATWEQLIDPGIVDFFEKPENWPYLDTLTDEQYRALWNEYEVSVNQVMDGKRIQIPGFMVSLDLSTDRIVDEFVFVPYQGLAFTRRRHHRTKLFWSRSRGAPRFGIIGNLSK